MLWYVVDRAFYAMCDLILTHGINTEIRDDRGLTPLAYAAMKNRMAFVNRMIASGADPNVLDTVIINYDYDTMDVTYVLALCAEHPTRPGCPDPTYPNTYYGKQVTVRDVLRAYRFDAMVDTLEAAAR